GSKRAHPSHLAAGTREAIDEAPADRVGRERHHNRDCVGCLHRGPDRCIAADHEHINRQTGELVRKTEETIQASFSATLFELEVLTLDIAEVAEPKQKLTAQIGHDRVCWPTRLEITYADKFRLRPRRNRPRRRPAKQCDELAATDHSITSSALASNDGGTLSPSILADFRLITSSTLVGCCTGRSAGFSPLRIRP